MFDHGVSEVASGLRLLRSELARGVALLDAVDELGGSDVAQIGETLCEIARLADANALIVAGVVDAKGAYRDRGERSARSWYAKQAGISVTEARLNLDAASQLVALSEATRAVRRGELSVRKTRIVAEAASVDPAAEHRLVETARHCSVAELRATATEIINAARPTDHEERKRRVHAARSFRSWIGSDGATHIHIHGSNLQLADVVRQVEAIADELYRHAQREGVETTRDQLLFDAFYVVFARNGIIEDRADLHRLINQLLGAATDADAETGDETGGETGGETGDGGGEPAGGGAGRTWGPVERSRKDARTYTHGRRAQQLLSSKRRRRPYVVVRVDHAALVRGELAAGEVCELTGNLGSVALHELDEIIDDAFVAVAVVDQGGDVLTVAHVGRGRTPRAGAWMRPGVRTKVIVRYRADDLRAEPGAPTVELAGVGAVRATLTEDRFGRALVERGIDVATLIWDGRNANAVQQTALEVRDPRCVTQGCPNAAHLDRDHVIEHRTTKHTTINELVFCCSTQCHPLRNQGWTYGPVNPLTGKRPLLAPTTSPEQVGEGSRAPPQAA